MITSFRFLNHLVLYFCISVSFVNSNVDSSQCQDSPFAHFPFLDDGSSTFKHCKWLSQANALEICQSSNVAERCPDTCQQKCYCKDLANQEYIDGKGTARTCKWIIQRRKTLILRRSYCEQNRNALELCPGSCNGWCMKTNEFATTVHKENVCKDKLRFRVDNENWKSCKWVAEWTEVRCPLLRVKENCPLTCGICQPVMEDRCQDDDTFTIDNVNWQTCEWVGKLWTKKRCELPNVKENCPVTCDSCADQKFTIAPTESPVGPMDVQQCYRQLANNHDGKQELMSSREWWNNTVWIDTERHAWFHDRLPYQPIVGDITLIAAVLFTVSQKTLKMSVLFPPLHPQESNQVTLILKGTTSRQVRTQTCQITPHIWHCLFRMNYVNDEQSYTYRLRYRPNPRNVTPTYFYDGIIPKPQVYPKVSALGCLGKDNTMNKHELVKAVLQTSPDMLILTGDQTYKHWNLGYGFLETLYSLNELTRSVPTILIMDDHDYGQGSLKGASDQDEDSGAGFQRPICLIQFIEDLMMSHNPDPARTTQLHNGMTSKYTSLQYGQLDFAITESRKFKQFPTTKYRDSILGIEQELWLQEWCSTNTDKVKVVLAVTPFANLVTHMTRKDKGYLMKGNNNRDSNGSPKGGRTRVLEILQGCANLIISGDQHLGIVATYDEYHISECVTPAVLNSIFWRLNYNAIGETHQDVYGNEYMLHNVWNVADSVTDNYPWARDTIEQSPQVKNARGDGFLTVEFDGTHANCGMHEYWLGEQLKWEARVEATNSELQE